MLRERSDDGNGNPILAAVGTLQFDGEYAFSERGSGAPAPILNWSFTLAWQRDRLDPYAGVPSKKSRFSLTE